MVKVLLRRRYHTTSLDDIKYQTYLTSFNSLKAEINALRTKIGITLGLLGVIFTIIIGYSLTTSYSIDNISPLLQAIYHISETTSSSLNSLTITPTKIVGIDFLLSLLISSLILLGLGYIWLYYELHNLKSLVFPNNQVLCDMEKITTRHGVEILILDNIKKSTNHLSINYNFYSVVVKGYDIFFISCLFILYLLYSLLASNTQESVVFSFLISIIVGALALVEIILFISLIVVIRKSKDENNKIDFMNNNPLIKYIRVAGISGFAYFVIVLVTWIFFYFAPQ